MENAPLAVIAIRKLNKTTGAARIALQQISILKDLGYRVKIICEEADKKTIRSYGGDLKIIRKFPLNGFIRRLWFSKRTNAWCRRNDPTLVISHGDIENSDVIYMHNCVDLAQEIIHPNATQQKSGVSKIHHRILNKSAYSRIVANSQLMADDLAKRYAIEPNKISISHPGFDALQFNSSVQKKFREKQRHALGVSEQVKFIGLITSGDFKKRNLDLFIDIADQLTKNAKNEYHFLVIGQGNIKQYQEKSAQYGILDHFTWKKTVSNIEHYYAALDLFVLPAHIEEFGCVVVEAMACATIPLISERVGAGEILQGELSELIVTGYDTEKWTHKIENLVSTDNSKIKKQLTETASHYTYEYQYNALKKLFFDHLQKNVKDDDLCTTYSNESIEK